MLYIATAAWGGGVGRVISNAPGNAPETTFTDSTAIPGVTYSYCVSAANGAGEGPQSSPAVSATIPLPAPTGVTATSDRTDGVLVDWRRVRDNAPYQSGTYYFRMAWTTSETGAKTELGSWTTNLTYLDTTPPVDTPLYYFVRAATTSSGTNASDWSVPVVGRVIPNAPTLLSISISGPDRVSASKTALYSCAATYSDGSTTTVSPAWSVSPSSAASINASGLLTAAAVSANATATISASFTDGTTKTATKDVTIVAPIKATAEVRNVAVASRWPFSPLLDIDYELVTSPSSAKASVSVFGRDEDHGVDMAATSLSGDGANGAYIAAGQHRLTWDIGTDYPNFHTTSFSVTMTATPSIIGVPENITVSASTSGVTLNWNAVEDATGYEVWRGTGTTTNGATRIATVTDATTYFDGTGTAGTTYRYWLRASGEDGIGEFAQPVTGTRVVIVPTSLAISGASSVTAGGTTTYTCTVTRNDGTSETITPTWSITSGSSYASISASGVLTAGGIATQQSVTIQASYTQNGTTVTTTKTVTINTKSVTITFNANGGSVSPTSKSYIAYGTYGSLPTPTYLGYAFAGWFTTSSGGTQVTTSSIVPATATTIFAHWTANTYTVTLDRQNGSGGTPSVTATYGSAMPSITVPTRSGYTFGGYYTLTGGNGTQYYTASGASARTWDKTSATTLYAKWVNNYATALDANPLVFTSGGDGSWVVVTDESYFGGSSVKSGAITHSQSTWLQTEVVGRGTLKFWYKVSSESNYDKVFFYIDGVQKIVASGTGSDWIQFEYSVTNDTQHTLKWVYSKDGSVSSGSDCCWIDKVEWTDGHEKVQLWEGGPYWATTNIGADEPWEDGYCFWWGDIVGYKYENGHWVASDGSSSSFSFNSANTPTDNKDISTLLNEGWITADGVLAPTHDAAHIKWGGAWRMPTEQEVDDLDSKCDWTWKTKNGVSGYEVRGRGAYSSNNIFLPCTHSSSFGLTGRYWSSTPWPNFYYSTGFVAFPASHYGYNSERYSAWSVRPVQGFTE